MAFKSDINYSLSTDSLEIYYFNAEIYLYKIKILKIIPNLAIFSHQSNLIN